MRKLTLLSILMLALVGCERAVMTADQGNGRSDADRADAGGARPDLGPVPGRLDGALDPRWRCETAADRTVCATAMGLPEEGTSWSCHQSSRKAGSVWICHGEGASPGGEGWNCARADGLELWRCEKPVETPDGRDWICWMGSRYGGIVCELGAVQPATQVGGPCRIGQKMWCSDPVYSGWGHALCDPATGRWKTITSSSGQTLLDCQASSLGLRPDTVCGCYHFFFNPDCCERPDCIVPEGTEGLAPQSCPASAGKLCSYCNPQLPSTCSEPGARCVVTNSHETMCGRECSSSACPAGYQCLTMKIAGAVAKQCVPEDFSCYY